MPESVLGPLRDVLLLRLDREGPRVAELERTLEPMLARNTFSPSPREPRRSNSRSSLPTSDAACRGLDAGSPASR